MTYEFQDGNEYYFIEFMIDYSNFDHEHGTELIREIRISTIKLHCSNAKDDWVDITSQATDGFMSRLREKIISEYCL